MKKYLVLFIIIFLFAGISELKAQVKKNTNIGFGGSYFGGQYVKLLTGKYGDDIRYKANIRYGNYYKLNSTIKCNIM